MGRVYISRFECGHPGCNEIANYESSRRADQVDLHRKYSNGKWKCIRHSNPEMMLSPQDRVRVFEQVNERKFYDGRDIGLYFGASGFAFGPGFRAFARDFPEGTILRVTAEIILPTDPETSGGRDG